MTLWEVEQFLNQTSDVSRSLADPWSLTDVQTFDPEVLLNAIMLKGGELGPIFNNIATYYKMNMYWWKKWEPTFQKWWVALEKEYEPLWDRNGWEDVHEDTVDVGTNDTTEGSTEVMDDDTTYSKTGSSTEVMDDDTTGSKSGTTENQVSAYDSNTYQPHDKSITSESESGTDDRTTTTNYSESGSGTDDRTTTFNKTIDNDTTGDRDFDRAVHSWGNWGISQTSQKLLYSEFEVRFKLNPYELMSDIYLKEMTDGVYV
jgi:hypothetical protein